MFVIFFRLQVVFSFENDEVNLIERAERERKREREREKKKKKERMRIQLQVIIKTFKTLVILLSEFVTLYI